MYSYKQKHQIDNFPTTDFKKFLVDVIQRLRPDLLQNSYNVSSSGFLLERHWQMEFYRACTSLLPPEHYISPDVGSKFGASGFVDFFINGTLNWAVEILREGLDMKEHAERFMENGKYAPMLKYTKQWAMIDFRSNKVR